MALNEAAVLSAPSLVSPSRKRTREALYHPYANATTNGTSTPTSSSTTSSRTYNGIGAHSENVSNGNGTNKPNNDSRVQYMVSYQKFYYLFWNLKTIPKQKQKQLAVCFVYNKTRAIVCF